MLQNNIVMASSLLRLVDSVFCNNEGAVDADARVLIEGVLFHDNAEPAVAIGLSTGGSVTNASFIDDGLLLDVQDYAVTNTLFDGPGARGDYTGDHNAWTDGPDGLFNVEDPGYWAGFIPGDCDTLPYLRSDSPLLGTGRDDKDIGAFGARLIYTPTKKSGGCAVSCRLPALACALLAMCAVTRRSGGFAR